MKVVAWFMFVILDGILLIASFMYHNYFLTVLSFVIALILNKYVDKIPMPKQFKDLKIVSRYKKE